MTEKAFKLEGKIKSDLDPNITAIEVNRLKTPIKR